MYVVSLAFFIGLACATGGRGSNITLMSVRFPPNQREKKVRESNHPAMNHLCRYLVEEGNGQTEFENTHLR